MRKSNSYSYVNNNPLMFTDPSGWQIRGDTKPPPAPRLPKDDPYENTLPGQWLSSGWVFGGNTAIHGQRMGSNGSSYNGWYNSYVSARTRGYAGNAVDYQTAYYGAVSDAYGGTSTGTYTKTFTYRTTNTYNATDGVYVVSTEHSYTIEIDIANDVTVMSSDQVQGGSDGRVSEAKGMSGDVVVAVGPVGFGYETGFFDYKGKTYEFFSFGYAVGLEGSIGLNYINIKDYEGLFSPMDFSGTSATLNLSVPFYTFGRESATFNSNDPYFTGYKANSHGTGISYYPFGLSYINGNTWVREYREKKIYSPWQLTHGR